MNTDLDSSIASVGVATVNALSSPFRSVKAKMNRNSMIKEIQQELRKGSNTFLRKRCIGN